MGSKIPGAIIGLGMAGACVWLATRPGNGLAFAAIKEGDISGAWKALTEFGKKPVSAPPASEDSPASDGNTSTEASPQKPPQNKPKTGSFLDWLGAGPKRA